MLRVPTCQIESNGASEFYSPLVLSLHFQTNILAAKKGQVKSVLFQEKDNVPAHSTVIEFKQDTES